MGIRMPSVGHVAFFLAVAFAAISIADLASLASRRKSVKLYSTGSCTSEYYMCKNGKCIKRSWLCDKSDDCGDNSDELYCGGSRYHYSSSCPSHYTFMRCGDGKCIPALWKCDETVDCSDGSDEANCVNKIDAIAGVSLGMKKAGIWIRNQASGHFPTNRWGINVPRTAMALYFSSLKYFSPTNSTGQTVTYEISLRLLEALLREEMDVDNLSSNDLAIYINALTVSCMNPRDFQGMDLVARLRSQVDETPSYVNPFVLMSLCNAGTHLSEEDIKKLFSVFEDGHRTTWTDIRSFALMALSCVVEKGDETHVSLANLTHLASQLKRTQHPNGSFENLPTTALVIQALISSGEDQADDWDISEAVKYIIRNQAPDGSFGSLLNTYYVIPVLKYKSLLDIDSKHCNTTSRAKKDEIENLHVQLSKQVHVKYSIGIGDDLKVVHTISLRSPVNSSFYKVMESAAHLDQKYKFRYVMRGSKPYVYELNGIQDDPELGKYWFLFNGTESEPKHLSSSPTDVVISDNATLMMWYRTPQFLYQTNNSTKVE